MSQKKRAITVKSLLSEISRERWDRKSVRVLARTKDGGRTFDVTSMKIDTDGSLVLMIDAREENDG